MCIYITCLHFQLVNYYNLKLFAVHIIIIVIGLFNRGFSLSGTALNPWVLAENSLEKAKRLATSMGCDTFSTKEMVDCMRYRPGRQLVQNVEQFFVSLLLNDTL